MAERWQKKAGRGRRKRPPKRLAFLCEAHFSKIIRLAISAIPGYQAVDPPHFQLDGLAPDRVLIRKATEHQMVLLTWNGDTIDHIRYPPGTHAGVLKLRLTQQTPSHVATCLGRFLRSQHFRVCKRSIVELHDDVAKVWSPSRRGPADYKEFPY